MFTAIIPIKKSQDEQLEIKSCGDETLLERKIRILKSVNSVTEIIVASDSLEVEEYAKKCNVAFFLRDSAQINESSFSDLVNDIVSTVTNEHVIWSFAITPFVDEKILNKAVEDYLELDFSIYDSLITCSELKRFILDENGPLNFKTGIRHQSSQQLPSLYLLINGFFIMSKELNLKYNYPWGKVPARQLVDNHTGFEIKSAKDFELLTKVFLPNREQI